MGGFNTPPVVNSDPGFDPSNFKVRRSLLPQLYDIGAPPEDTASSAGARFAGTPQSSRLEDDPKGYTAGMEGSTADLESRVSTTAAPKFRPVAPDDHMAQLEAEYNAPAPQQQPLSLKQKILMGVAGAIGGPGPVERAQGQRQQQQEFNTSQYNQNRRNLLSEIEAERRMQEQEGIEGQRMAESERGQNLRAQMAAQQQDSANQRLIETIKAEGQRQQAGFAQQGQLENQREQNAQDLEDKRLAAQVKIAGMREQNQGSLQLEEDGKGNPVLFNNKTGEVRPATGVQKPGTFQKSQGANEAFNFADMYMNSKQFSGPSDEAMMEKYFELAKPSSGFRMTQNQMDMLLHARSWMGSLQGRAYHAASGKWFSDHQRQQIYDTMKMLAQSKGVDTGGGGQTQELRPPGEAGPNMKWQHRTNNGKVEWRQVPAQ